MGMADEHPTSTDPAATDCFGPPAEPCECFCLHCRRTVLSSDMWYQRIVNAPGRPDDGFWMCPTPNCDGKGFTFDIWPTDPDHPANDGWSDDDDDEEAEGEFTLDDTGEEEADAEYDPAEPQYAADDGDDIDGDEWKHGLEPGERPRASPAADAARAAWEAEQRQYDEPDRRPRTIDGSQWPEPKAGPIGEDDIPY
jgi:hypothetical protein